LPHHQPDSQHLKTEEHVRQRIFSTATHADPDAPNHLRALQEKEARGNEKGE
jgi:hypothetical protein